MTSVPLTTGCLHNISIQHILQYVCNFVQKGYHVEEQEENCKNCSKLYKKWSYKSEVGLYLRGKSRSLVYTAAIL